MNKAWPSLPITYAPQRDDDYKALYEIMISIANECAGVEKTPIEGWDRYARNCLAEKKRKEYV